MLRVGYVPVLGVGVVNWYIVVECWYWIRA